MKRYSTCIVLVLLTLMFTEVSAQKAAKKEAITVTPEDLKWEELGAGGGAANAKLWGDDTKGAYAAFTKFPAGFKAPLHYHSNDAKIVVIQGAYIYNGKEYGPGSYLFIPGGQKHESGGSADSETIFFMEQPGKFDLKPVKPAK